MNELADGKRRKSHTSAAMVMALSVSGAPQRAKPRHRLRQRWSLGRRGELDVDLIQLRRANVQRGPEMIERELRDGIVEALRAHPLAEPTRPSLTMIGTPATMTEQERLHAVLDPSAIILQVLAHTDQVADGLFCGRGHAYRGELAGAVQPSEVGSVEPVGLHALARASRDQGGSDDVAGHVQVGQESMNAVAGGAGFVTGDERCSIVSSDDLAKRLRTVRDDALVGLERARAKRRHRDRVLVHVQANVRHACIHDRSSHDRWSRP
jgi:hypothetical protein